MRLDVEETEDYYVFIAEGGKEEDFYWDQGPRLPDYEMWEGRQMLKKHNSFLKQLPKMIERSEIQQKKLDARRKGRPG